MEELWRQTSSPASTSRTADKSLARTPAGYTKRLHLRQRITILMPSILSSSYSIHYVVTRRWIKAERDTVNGLGESLEGPRDFQGCVLLARTNVTGPSDPTITRAALSEPLLYTHPCMYSFALFCPSIGLDIEPKLSSWDVSWAALSTVEIDRSFDTQPNRLRGRRHPRYFFRRHTRRLASQTSFTV